MTTSNAETLKSLLKKKGIGPTMGKTLTPDELQQLSHLMLDPTFNLTTKATLLTALLTLPPTPDEQEWITSCTNTPSAHIPQPLHDLVPNTPIATNRPQTEQQALSHIKTIISGQDLPYTDCKWMCDQLFNPDLPDYLKAAFLEGERLKRESPEENEACYDALWDTSKRSQTNLPLLIDLSNAYDGFNRTPLISPFVAAILGALGYPTLIHGCKEVAPKKGMTAYKLLELHNYPVTQSLEEATAKLTDTSIGWAYCDQSISHPQLHQLVKLREDMVKRPVLATMEKLLQPLQAKNGNHLITGYTHTPYKQKMTDLLIKKNHAQEILILRGSEGSCQAPIDRRCPAIHITKTNTTEDYARPSNVGLEEVLPELPESLTSTYCLQEGLNVLQGQDSVLKPLILHQVYTLLTTLNLLPLNIAQEKVSKLLAEKTIKIC